MTAVIWLNVLTESRMGGRDIRKKSVHVYAEGRTPAFDMLRWYIVLWAMGSVQFRAEFLPEHINGDQRTPMFEMPVGPAIAGIQSLHVRGDAMN